MCLKINKNKNMTIAELKQVLNQLDTSFDDYEIFNGECDLETNQLIKQNPIIADWFNNVNKHYVLLDQLIN